jgi:hypothetical protein
MFVQTVYDRQPATETLVQSKYVIEVDKTDTAGYTVDSVDFYWEDKSTLAVFNVGDYLLTVTDSDGIYELEPDGILRMTPDPTGRVRFEIVLTDDR